MRVQDIQRAQDLLLALSEGINQQAEILDGLRASLEDYREFLLSQIKELRDE